jgi:predicted acylesterase/phospholipase RssA
MNKHCKIWEAARATSAASTLFDPIAIGPRGETFVDGALGFNNPIRLLDRESRDLWPNEDRVFLSIGTGSPPSRNMQGDIFDLAKRLGEIVVETERTANGFQQDNPALVSENRYYRFNVLHGLEDVKLQEYQATAQIYAVTETYLELSDTVTKAELFISSVAATGQ